MTGNKDRDGDSPLRGAGLQVGDSQNQWRFLEYFMKFCHRHVVTIFLGNGFGMSMGSAEIVVPRLECRDDK